MKPSSLIASRFFFIASLLVTALGGLPRSSYGSSIGVNFGATSFGTLTSSDVAGLPAFAQANYNNVSAAATGLSLVDDAGLATGVTLTTTGANSFSVFTGNPVSGPDEILYNTRANSTGTSWSFTLSGITYANYAIIVYDLQFATGAVIGVGIGGTTYYSSSPAYNGPGYIDNNAATPFTYTQATSIDPLNPTPLSDYVLFTGLSGSSVTVNITGGANATRISGFQIVQIVPEPSTWAMLSLGGIAMLVGVRRSYRNAQT